MPTRERIADFIAAVVGGDHVGAIRDYYHADATMQENTLPPRCGRDALMAHERAALERLQRMHTHPVATYLVDGDHVVIKWTFDAVGKDGSIRRLEELALQRWQDDRIAEERLYYDTATAWRPVNDDQEHPPTRGTKSLA